MFAGKNLSSTLVIRNIDRQDVQSSHLEPIKSIDMKQMANGENVVQINNSWVSRGDMLSFISRLSQAVPLPLAFACSVFHYRCHPAVVASLLALQPDHLDHFCPESHWWVNESGLVGVNERAFPY